MTVAGVAVSYEDETKHFKFMGTTGSGKSTVMRELLDGALKRGDRAIIADPDGGYLSRFYNPARGDRILNPFDHRSGKWNLFAEIKTTYDVDQLARAFIPDRGSSDTTWTSYARTFFSSVVRQAQVAKIQELAELYRLLTAARREELKIFLDGTPAAPFLEEGSERLFGGVRSTTSDHVKTLDYVREQTGQAFAVRDWVKSGRGVLFLPYQADQIAALKSIISTWMRLAIFQTMSLGEGDHRIWFAVDELDALGPIDGLSDALTRLRKFGGRCALGFQSISQVSTTYGQGVAQAMVENCGNSLVLRCSASENGGTSRFASRLIGDRQILRLSRSVSRSRGEGFFGTARDTEGHSEQHAIEAAVMPAEIEQLPDRCGFLKFTSQPQWMKVTFPYYDIPKVAAPFTGDGRMIEQSTSYVDEYIAAMDRTQALGLEAPVRVLVRKDCVDMDKVRPVLLDYFERHRPEELIGQTAAIHFALVPLLMDKTGIPFNLTIGWMVRKGRVIYQHDEAQIKRFLKEKSAAWMREGLPFHLWLTSPACEILDVTFAMNLGWAESREECERLLVYQSSSRSSTDHVYHPMLVGPAFFHQIGAVC